MRKQRLTRILAAKFVPEQAALIQKVAAQRGEDTSSFLRRGALLELARLGYLRPEEAKALGRS